MGLGGFLPRDYYDIHILYTLRGAECKKDILRQALEQTARKRGTGRQSQHAVRLRDYLRCQNVRCHLAHLFIILYSNDIHSFSLLKSILHIGVIPRSPSRDTVDASILAMGKAGVNGITDLCNLFVFL